MADIRSLQLPWPNTGPFASWFMTMSEVLKRFMRIVCGELIISVFAADAAPAGRLDPDRTKGAIVIASAAGAKLDSDLRVGGGSNDTELIQGILNRARSGSPVHLILDGPALITGLDVYSQTTIECIAGAGFYLKDDSDRAVIRNSHRSRDAIKDEYITIRGCFLNGNREGQQREAGPFQSQGSANQYYRTIKQEADGTFKSGMQFFGVSHLTLEDVTLFHTRAFGAWFANATHVNIRDVVVDSNFPPFPENVSVEERKAFIDKIRTHDDGLHFNGPIRYLTIDGLKLRTEDDGIGLNANDMGVDDMTRTNDMGPYVGQGPISDVTIRNVTFMDSLQGLRLLSTTERIDRVLIENVSGIVRHRIFILSHFVDRRKTGTTGNFGSIIFANVNATLADFSNWHQLNPDLMTNDPWVWDIAEEGDIPVFSINARIESLSLANVVIAAVDERPIIRIGREADVEQMKVDLLINDPRLQAIPLRLSGGRIEKLDFSLSWQGQYAPGGKPAIQNKGGTIEHLDMRDARGGK